MNVGGELERARESLGLSLDQISDRTKVSVERLAAIEQNAFEQLPPIVYVRGYVRSYATEVGLDPDDVTERYLAQFEETSTLQDASAVDVVEDREPVIEGKEAADRVDDWDLDAPVAAHEAARIESEPEKRLPVMVGAVAAASNPLWHRAEFLPRTLGGDRASVEPATSSPAEIAPPHRIPVKALAAAAVITLALGYLVSTNLDRFWQAEPSGGDVPAADTADEASADKAGGEVAPATAAASVEADRAAAPAPAQDAATAASPEPDAPVAANTTGNAAPVEDVSGSWMLTTQVESSSFKSFNNLRLGYRVEVQQSGNRVTGSGFKWTENGREIAANGRTPILLEGILKGRRLDLKFTESGARRASGGTLVMEVADDGSMRGNFVSDAARSRGSSQAKRTP